MPDGRQERIAELARREVLRSGAFLGATAGVGASGAAATELAAADRFLQSRDSGSDTFVVIQDGQAHEVEPLSYQDQRIEDFYNYRGIRASADTPTDVEQGAETSKLFLYEDDGGVSLVAIHDFHNAPGSTASGGEAVFTFDGLDGSWVVRDDSGDWTRSGSSPPEKIRWAWNNRNTDGGVFRFASEEFSVTVNPDFRSGITDWEFLSGDARNPQRIDLDLGSPVTVSVGSPMEIEDVRVVQSFENTRYSEQQDLDTFDDGQIEGANVEQFGDGGLVAGKASAVVFDVAGSPGGDGSEVDFEVTRHYDDGSSDTATITLPRTVVESASGQDDSLVGAVVDAGETGRWNVAALDGNISRVEVASASGGSATVDVTRSVTDMPTLTLGFVGVHGQNAPYGTISSTQAYEDFVENTARLVQSMFPVERVDVVWADLDERHVDRTRDLIGNPLYSLTVLNAASARRTILDAIRDTPSLLDPDDDSFADTFSIVNGSRLAGPSLDDVDAVDAVIGATPDDYLANVPAGEPGWTGIHYGGDSVQPDIAALAEVGHPMTAAQEIGHHFLGHDFFPRNVAQEDPNGPDTGHANDDLVSTKYDLADGFGAERAAPSFMSYSASRWMDALSHEHMVSEQFSPTPRTGTLVESAIDSVFAAGAVSGDDVSVWTASVTRSRTTSDVGGSDATMTATGADGQPIEERGVQFGTTARPGDDGGPDPSSDQLVLEDVFVGRVPFPEDAVGLEVSVTTQVDGDRQTLTTRVDPFSRTLREAIEAVPAGAVDNYRGFVESNLERLDAVEGHALADRHRNAIEVLDAVERSVRKHLEPGYDISAATTLSREQLLSLLDGYRDRLSAHVTGKGK